MAQATIHPARFLTQNGPTDAWLHDILNGERIAIANAVMIKLIRFLLPLGILVSSLVLTTQLSVAKPDYTKKEKKGCTTCHVAAAKKELNAVGKCYEEKKSLDTCEAKKK